MNPLIINRPSLQSSSQRMIYPVITFIFWMLWIYIWLPLVSLVAWGFGVQLYYDEMILESGLESFLSLAGTYAMMIALLGASLISWALYNWKRFKNKERRSKIESLSTEEVAEYFNVDKNDLMGWHGANRIVVHHNDKGDVEHVEI
jgi:biofilm PGA synthesis protein PgaD